jgi:hypothetical protein
MFVDILYEHTQDLLENSGIPRQPLLPTIAPLKQARINLNVVEESSSLGASTEKIPRKSFHSLKSTRQHEDISHRRIDIDPTCTLDYTSQEGQQHPLSRNPHFSPLAGLQDTDPDAKGEVLYEEISPLSTEPCTSQRKEEWHPSKPKPLGQLRIDDRQAGNEQSLELKEGDWTALTRELIKPGQDAVTSSARTLFSKAESIAGPEEHQQLILSTGSGESSDETSSSCNGAGLDPPERQPLDGIDWMPSINEIKSQRAQQVKRDEVQQWMQDNAISSHLDHLGALLTPDMGPVDEYRQLETLQEKATLDNDHGDSGSETERGNGEIVKYVESSELPPKDRLVPPTSNSTMMLYRTRAKDIEDCSVAATCSSASDNYNPTFNVRSAEGTKARKDFFASNKDDSQLRVVQELLLKWTTVDEPVPARRNLEGKQTEELYDSKREG